MAKIIHFPGLSLVLTLAEWNVGERSEKGEELAGRLSLGLGREGGGATREQWAEDSRQRKAN